MSDDAFEDDLIGGSLEDLPKKRGRGRPRNEDSPPKPKWPPKKPKVEQAAYETPDDRIKTGLGDVYGGVSATWLAQVFGHDKNTIAKRLASAGVEVVGRRNGGPLYRIPDAAAHLVKPKVDLVAYIKTLRPNDLPPILNVAYWDAMLKRQKFEENARDLWRTDDVLEVFGDLAFGIKTTVNLWVEEVDRTQGLTPEQRNIITQLSDKLLTKIHEQMVDAPKRRSTPSSVAEEGVMPMIPPEPVEPEQEDFGDV